MGATLSYETRKRSSKLGTRMYPYEPPLAMQLHQSNFSTEDEWIKYMMMNVDAQNAPVYEYNVMILKPPQHLFEVKPESYCPKLVTIGPLYQNLQKSPIDRCKALCMKKFMGRHGILNVDDLHKKLKLGKNEFNNVYIELPSNNNGEFLNLLVTVDTVFIHEFLLFWLHKSDENRSYFSTFYINGHTLPLRLPRDLLLMGNQIPMSFLKKIALEISNNRDFSPADLQKAITSFIMKHNPFFSHDPSFHSGLVFESDLIECQHLLDLLYVTCTKTFKKCGSQVSIDVPRTETVEASDSQVSANDSRPKTGQGSESHGSVNGSHPKTGQGSEFHGSVNGSHPKTGQGSEFYGSFSFLKTGQGSFSFLKTGQASFSFLKTGHESFSFLKTGQRSNAAETKKQTKKHRRLPPASELSKSGISFKACKGNITVVKYEKEKLQLDLPELVVYDSTEDVLRSLIAHERASKAQKEQKEFAMYAKIMDMLIDTEEDLAILTQAKVIENHLGNGEKLVDMWNGMCIGINVEENSSEKWEQMIHDILAHHSSRWRRWYVEFRAVYFSRPWLPISILAAFTLLSASILQTIYTVLGFYQSDNNQ